ncbi:AAA family ATPase [Mesorhizobium sp. B2-4-8]|uniref:AAA family ATPase n=1 Tax=Mesorhizobium sp. B2-4-8 TaxID=2589941 RepID=UPI0015E2A826|nr:AAA family ATPase [Mesorhizobium sp. B2-4-8]
MTHPNSYEMPPFALPAGFGEGDDAAPGVNLVSVDPREHALECLKYYAHNLYGDIVLVPFVDGQPDWANTTRDTLEEFAGHWDELDQEDVPRLGVLTDSFAKFLDYGLGYADDVSILTLWREGTPDVRQIGGEDCPVAKYLITEALIDDEPLMVRQAKPEEPQKKEPPKAANDNHEIFVINPANWHGLPVPRREWFIEDMIPMRQVTILNGDGGVGKSLLALQIAASSALSVDTLGLEPLAKPVLYIGAEDGADEFQRRLADIVDHHGHGFEDLFRFRLLPLADRDALLCVPNRAGAMEPTALWKRIVMTIQDHKPGLVVLDTAADLFGGDEIKRSQVRQFISMLRKVAMDSECAVLLLAHPSVSGMQSGTGSSGSTAWNNSVRSRLYMTRPEGKDDVDPDARVLTTKKINYGKKGGEIRMRWQGGVFVLDDGKPSAASGLLNKRTDETFRSLLSSVNRTGQRVASTRGVNYAPAVLAARPDAGGFTKKQFEAAMQRLLADGIVKVVWEGPPSKQRQRLIVSAEDFGPESEAED